MHLLIYMLLFFVHLCMYLGFYFYLFYAIYISTYLVLIKQWCAKNLDLGLFMFIFDPFRVKRWLRAFSTVLVLYKIHTTKISIDWVISMDPFVYICIQLLFLCFNVMSTRYTFLRFIFTFIFGTLNLFTVWCIYLIELDIIYQKKLYVFNLSKVDSLYLSYQEICDVSYIKEGVGLLHYFVYNIFSVSNVLQICFYFLLYIF